jgi:hypothetical protein
MPSWSLPPNGRQYRERCARVSHPEHEFIERGLASREEARRSGEYVDSDVVLAELDTMLANGRAKPAE